MSSVSSNAPNLDDHLLEALESSKDRLSVLRLEQEIVLFLDDTTRDVLEVPSSNSYQRRLAYKTGDYYQLTHVSDASRQLLLFHKHPWSKVPSVKLCDVIVKKESDMPKMNGSVPPRQVKIMKRVVNKPVLAEPNSPASVVESASEAKEKEKSDKEERYKAARARIFQGVEEANRLNVREKTSKPTSKNNSRSNSRDARNKTALNGDAADFSRRVSEPYSYEAGAVHESEIIQKRHQQYYQMDSQDAASFQRPPVDAGKNFSGVWNPKPTAPLSAANLAALEAQTSSKPLIGPSLQTVQSPVHGRLFMASTAQRSLAPPATASANLWGPPVTSGKHAQRSASSMGLNLSASPWTPKQQTTTETLTPRQAKTDTIETAEEHDEDPTNVLRGLALDEK